jgi:hypothetical protein
MSRTRTIALALASTLLTTAPLAAQSTASASLAVTAKVVNPISLSVTAPLDFGAVFAGTPKTITPDAANGGRFTITGEAGAAIAVTLQMPTVVTASGGATIPLSSWTYAMSYTPSLTGASPVSFSATGGTPINGTLPGTAGTVSHAYFSIGATASPGASAATGSYSATGQITVAYVGM